MLIQYCYCSYSYGHYSLLTPCSLLLCWCSCCCDSFITMRDSTCLSRLNFSPSGGGAARGAKRCSTRFLACRSYAEIDDSLWFSRILIEGLSESRKKKWTFIPLYDYMYINQPTGQVHFFFGDSTWLHPASAAVTSPKWRLSFRLASCSRWQMILHFSKLTPWINSENSHMLNPWL